MLRYAAFWSTENLMRTDNMAVSELGRTGPPEPKGPRKSGIYVVYSALLVVLIGSSAWYYAGIRKIPSAGGCTFFRN